MPSADRSAHEVRRALHDILREERDFEGKARDALELGTQYLDVDEGYLARVDPETDHWEVIVSTDSPGGQFRPGLERDLETTYCRETVSTEGPLVLHDAPAQGWAEDPAFRTQGLGCYHGTTLLLDDEPYGTVCFVAAEPRTEPFGDGETLFVELVARLLEHELQHRRQQEELTRRANLVTVLNRVLRHNLRNDMTVIRGRTQLMADQLEGDPNGDIALRKIDDVMQLCEKARELQGVVSQDLDHQHTDIVGLVERVVDRVDSAYPRASFSVRADPQDGITAAVLPSFEGAVREVVENAAKHGGESPSVTITVESVPNAVEIHVADDGPGLSDQERKVLKTGAETPLVHGSGLGLWLVHWIVSTHDGTVEATVTDTGTTMRISVPRSPEMLTGGVTELRQARDRYQAAFEEAYDAMVIVDDDTRIVDANPEAATIYGLDRQKLLGRSIREFLPAEFDFESAWESFRDAGRERDTVTIVGGDGVNRTVAYSAATDVVPGQHLVVARDITQRVERERKLAQAETVFEHTQDAIFLVDVTDDGEFRVERVNEVYEAVTGLTNAEIQGQTPRDVLGDEIGAEIESRYRECLQRRETIEYTEEIPVDGEPRFWATKLTPVVEDGTVESLVGAMRDVTEQKRRERAIEKANRRLRTVTETVEAAIFIKDAEGRYQLMNQRCREILGLDPDRDVEGLTDHDLLPPETAKQYRADDRYVLESGESITVEETVPTPDGKRTFLTVKSPILDAEGDPSGICAVATDISDRQDRD